MPKYWLVSANKYTELKLTIVTSCHLFLNLFIYLIMRQTLWSIYPTASPISRTIITHGRAPRLSGILGLLLNSSGKGGHNLSPFYCALSLLFSSPESLCSSPVLPWLPSWQAAHAVGPAGTVGTLASQGGRRGVLVLHQLPLGTGLAGSSVCSCHSAPVHLLRPATSTPTLEKGQGIQLYVCHSALACQPSPGVVGWARLGPHGSSELLQLGSLPSHTARGCLPWAIGPGLGLVLQPHGGLVCR